MPQAAPRAPARSGGQARDRPGSELHDRRSMAGCRLWAKRGMRDDLDRPWLHGALARGVRARPHGRLARRGCGVDHCPRATEATHAMSSLSKLRVKIFADGADRVGMLEMYRHPWIRGFTTNPTLMRKAGVTDYAAFASDILSAIPDRPISFEVFSDDLDEMERQARVIAQWGA